MASQGPLYPSSGTNSSAIGTLAWSNPGNITLDDTSVAATVYQNEAGWIDNNVSLILADGTISSTNKASASGWPLNAITYATYGGSSDLWGETWTPADINDADFGVAMSAKGATSGTLTTNYLKGSAYGFSIPTGSTINGIEVGIKRCFNPNVMDQTRATVDTIRITVYYTEGTASITNVSSMTNISTLKF